MVALAVFVTAASCGAPEPPPPTPTATATPIPTPTSTPLPTATPVIASWVPPAAASAPEIIVTPRGLGPVLGAGQSGRISPLDTDGSAKAPAGCDAIPSERIQAEEVLRCADLALVNADSMRVDTYVHVLDAGQSDPRIKVEAEGIYVAPATVRIRLGLALRGASQLRSEVIQAEGVRYSRSESYNKVSGRRVVTDGWLQEIVEAEDHTRLLDTARLEYALRLAALRSGLDNPRSEGCAEDELDMMGSDEVDGRLYHVVRLSSPVETPDGQPCDESPRTSITYWVDSTSFRFWRIVMKSDPGPNSPDRRVSWLGQTVFSDYGIGFVIEPPQIPPTPVPEQP